MVSHCPWTVACPSFQTLFSLSWCSSHPNNVMVFHPGDGAPQVGAWDHVWHILSVSFKMCHLFASTPRWNFEETFYTSPAHLSFRDPSAGCSPSQTQTRPRWHPTKISRRVTQGVWLVNSEPRFARATVSILKRTRNYLASWFSTSNCGHRHISDSCDNRIRWVCGYKILQSFEFNANMFNANASISYG